MKLAIEVRLRRRLSLGVDRDAVVPKEAPTPRGPAAAGKKRVRAQTCLPEDLPDPEG